MVTTVSGLGWSVASSVAYARERERVLRICDAAGEPRTLRLELLEAIRRVVGFDAYAWLVTDPDTSVGCAPFTKTSVRSRRALLSRALGT